jgi:RNA polymerase sigma factor (sigma-70 family)
VAERGAAANRVKGEGRDGGDGSADVVAAQQGDRGAFTRLVAAHQNLVCSITLAILRDVPASQDVAQEVFVNAWRTLCTLRDPALFLPWLKQLARNAALNTLRSEKRRKLRDAAHAIDPRTEDAITCALSVEERRVLDECIDDLPDQSRELMILFYREEQSVSRVAALLEIKEDAVKKRLQRARQSVRASVLARFGELALATAPTAGFTAVVAGLLLATGPATAAAITASGTKSAVVIGKAGWLGAAIPGIVAGLGGVVLGYAVHASAVADPKIKRALLRLSAISGGLIVSWVLLFSAGVAAGVASPVLVASYLALVLAHGWLYAAPLPRVLGLQDQALRSAIRRRYLWFMAAFLIGATVGTTTMILAVMGRAG